jgi:hypothetical protein
MLSWTLVKVFIEKLRTILARCTKGKVDKVYIARLPK